MEIHIDDDLQAKLANLATQQGRDTDALLQDALQRYLDDEIRFLQGVERGVAAAERGDFIEEEKIDARVERMLRF